MLTGTVSPLYVSRALKISSILSNLLQQDWIIFVNLKVERIDGAVVGNSMNSRINIVDLAGSERQSLAKTSGDRLRVRL